ncbi:hypothetical protein D3C87_1320070 [compost metagenome]
MVYIISNIFLCTATNPFIFIPFLAKILAYTALNLSSHFTALKAGKYIALRKWRFPFFDIFGFPFTDVPDCFSFTSKPA